MKKSQPWHHTRFGAVTLWLGSLELAVPVLAFTAAALAVGTYLESTRDTRVAREFVYGAWWFIALMALVCVSLVFAVISRYPWKTRHIGFITVHAALIALIIGGFWSMFGRVEGHLALEEGQSGDSIETEEELLELLEHQAGDFATIGTVHVPRTPAVLDLSGVRMQFVERWANTREQSVVSNDSPGPFRAIQVSPMEGAGAVWVGEEEKAGGASVVAGLRIRVLSDGTGWEPPPAHGTQEPGFAFVAGDQRYPLADEGQEAIPGWTIVTIRRFERGLVSAGGLTENPSGPENPAIDVIITDGAGTRERHTAFLNFADMVMNRTLEGAAQSGARLIPTGGGREPETLIVYGPINAMGIGYVASDGTARAIDPPASLPATLDLGSRRVTILQQFDRARGDSRIVKAAKASENRPALVVRAGDATELIVVPWKGMASIHADGRHLMARFGPGVVPLPFSVHLSDFRKSDYPGTDMAMAYESDVFVTLPDKGQTSFRIYMNNPYTHGPWKVYQSGFVGDRVSVFSVMRDPGLTLTYIGSTFLCIGIVVIFYSRSLSWGHPGIPVAFAHKEPPHAQPLPARAVDRRPAPVEQPVGSCSV